MPFWNGIEVVVLSGKTVSVWPKCRQRRPSFFSTFLKRVPPPKSAVKKTLDAKLPFRNKTPHVSCFISFRARCQGIDWTPFSLKGQRCPRCGQSQTLNRHSFLYGNDSARVDGRWSRGQRVFCSNRGQRGGCGQTFSVFLAGVLPRHTFTAPLLWKLLSSLLAGASIRAGAGSLPFALETLYALVRRLRRRLDAVRCLLCRRQQPPASSQADPLLQTIEHLQSVFPHHPIEDFQILFQSPLLG